MMKYISPNAQIIFYYGVVSKPYLTVKNAEFTQRAQYAICLEINPLRTQRILCALCG